MNYSFYIYEFNGYYKNSKYVPSTFEEYFREAHLEQYRYWLPTTASLRCNDIYVHRNLLDLKEIEKLIEDGYVIIPFSNKIYLVDLLNYINLGLKICFMKSTTFKAFRKVYKQYI